MTDATAPISHSPLDRFTITPLTGLRLMIARRTSESFREAPHFPLVVDIDMGAAIEARTRFNAAATRETKASLNDFVIRAAALTLAAVPAANVGFFPDGQANFEHADVAVAVAVDGGLVTPIVRQAELKSLARIAEEMTDLSARARTMRLSPREYKGGSFTISNLGMFGVRQFASILNAPHGCILSVGAVEERPVGRDGQIVLARMMTVTLTCDHRVVDGVTGARFLRHFKALLEAPAGLVGDLMGAVADDPPKSIEAFAGMVLPTVTAEITLDELLMFSRATGQTDSVHLDQEVAVAAGFRSIVAPPTFAWCAFVKNHDTTAAFRAMGRRLRQLRHAEQVFDYHEPICAGDRLVFDGVVSAAEAKPGGRLEFVVRTVTARNQLGQLVVVMRSTTAIKVDAG